MDILTGPVEMPDVLREQQASHGDAYASFRPNTPVIQNAVALVVAGQPVVCSRREAEDALWVLAELFGPLAESHRVARRVAGYGVNGGAPGGA